MNKKHTLTAVVIAVVVIIVIVAGIETFAVRPSADGTYTKAPSAVRALPHTSATNGQLTLRLNSVSNASDPTIAAVWERLSPQARSAGVYFRALTSSPGTKDVIANITVSNARDAPVPFTYTDFYLVGRSGNTYYANYAVCNSSCSAAALKNRSLNVSFASDLYVLFSVPVNTDVVKVVYASSPPIVFALS